MKCQNPRCKRGEEGGKAWLSGRQQKFCCDPCRQAVYDQSKKVRKKKEAA